MPDFRSYVGNTIEISIDCLLDHVATDPANLIVRVYDEAGNISLFTFGVDDEIEKLSAGRYKFFMETDASGTWKVVIRMWGGPFRRAATKDYIVAVAQTVFAEYP